MNHSTTTAKRPTAHEAEAMWRGWIEQKDARSRDRLILSYMPMVTYIASAKIRELPSHFELEDLISCGLVALMEAIDRFDPAKGATFEQFAWTRVAGSIIDELRRHDPATRTARRIGREAERARQKWTSTHGREPSDEELAYELELDIRELRARLAELERSDLLSLNSLVSNTEESIELGDTLASPSNETSPEIAALGSERSAAIRSAISALSDREREILHLLHVRHLKAVEIGRLLGVSESRISQILSGIRSKLTDQLAAYELV